MKKLIIIVSMLVMLPFLVLTGSFIIGVFGHLINVGKATYSRQIHSGRCETTQLLEDVSSVMLSPERDKALFQRGNDVFVMSTKTEEILFKGEIKTETREMTSFEWFNNEELLVVMNIFIDNSMEEYKTKNLVEFTKCYRYDARVKHHFSNSYQKALVQDKKTEEIVIQYENNKTWDTGIGFDFLGIGWSCDDRFVMISSYETETQYIIDTATKQVIQPKMYLSGRWAPTRNIYYSKDGVLFYPETMSYVYLDVDGLENGATTSYQWSPDSQYILIINDNEFLLYDIDKPKKIPKSLAKVEGFTEYDRRIWSKNMDSILCFYPKTGHSLRKPMDYYVSKIDIETGKVDTIYVDGLLYGKFYWVDDNIIYHEIDHQPGLFKSKLLW